MYKKRCDIITSSGGIILGRVVVIGGGWAGCAASIAAKKAGADEVVLIERCDMLLGTGLVGGIMRNNGRTTATEEAVAMGGGDLFEVTDSVSRHRNIEFPGHRNAFLYDVTKVEPAVRNKCKSYDIKIMMRTRVKDIIMDEDTITSVVTEEGSKISGDVFVETTGTSGPPGNCAKLGNGCVMCIYRCPTFGPRISIAGKAGVKEKIGTKGDGSIGVMSGSCKLHKESLHHSIVQELHTKGVAIIPVPKHLRKGDGLLGIKACQQYALKEFAENIILLDTGHAKLMSPFYPLEMLREIPGFENARFEDPYSGGVGNSIRYLAISPRDNFLKTTGIGNLFCAGEKCGLLVGHTEAIITGTLAGHNAVRFIKNKNLLQIPESLVCGDIIAFANKEMKTEKGMTHKYTFSGDKYFERMKEKGLYTLDVDKIKKRVKQSGMINIFNQMIKMI